MVDSIDPIVPGPSPVSARLPVEPLERISRERDRPARERRERPPGRTLPEAGQAGRRREPGESTGAGDTPGEDDGERPHVDVRV